ncbi:MAG: hypothetical protein ACP5UH_02345 [Candidatus Micrarchaeia archaeon]
MHFAKMIIYALVLSMLGMGVSGALTTVTLSGTCSGGIVNASNPYFNFSLFNSGNGFASSIIAEPLFNGFSTYNSTFALQSLGPNSTYRFIFKLKNFSTPGSYVESIILSYRQGTSSFTTMYSCIASVGKQARSLLTMPNGFLKDGKLNTTVLNIANYTINSTVKIYAPPLFVVQPSSINISVKPFAAKTVIFNISMPKYNNATMPIGVGVSYINDGTHYASLSLVNAVLSNAKAPLMSYTEIGAIAVILVIVALIIVSATRARKAKKRAAPPESAQPAQQ